jgi:hypothetical protein
MFTYQFGYYAEQCLYDHKFVLGEDFGVIYPLPGLSRVHFDIPGATPDVPATEKKRKSLRLTLFPLKLLPSFGKLSK